MGRKVFFCGRGDGGSCFDLCEICAAAKTTEISMLALPPTWPTLSLAGQLNPSLCVPHSCMDLSAMGQGAVGGGYGEDRQDDDNNASIFR